MKLTTEEVRHLAVLARVGMTDEEIERMRDQMSHILENFDVLEQVDTDAVEPSSHLEELGTVMRPDEVADSSPTAGILANAPATEGDFVRIRAVLDWPSEPGRRNEAKGRER